MFRKALEQLFTAELLNAHKKEWGVEAHCPTPQSIGYATTVSPEAVERAVELGVDLIVAHHDAWDFMFEYRERVYKLLRKHKLTLVWAHLPLDRADFGTSATLLEKMGCQEIRTCSADEGRIGTLIAPTDFASVCSTLNALLEEEPRAVYNSTRPIQNVGCVTGAGAYTSYLQAMAGDIDLYITGETSLYLLEYAKHHHISVAIYSHNYTELPGVKEFAKRLGRLLQLEVKGHLGDSYF